MTDGLTPLSVRVTRAIKAELARRDLDGAALIEPLRMGRNAVYARLRYEQPFNLDDIEKIADVLGMDVDSLLQSAKTSPVTVLEAVAS